MKTAFISKIGNPVSILLLLLALTGCNTSGPDNGSEETGEPVWTEIDPFFCDSGCDGVAWNAVSFPEGKTGYVVGFGIVGKTTDAGETWTHVKLGEGSNLQDVDFISASTGWVTGEKTHVFKTTDGGQTWNQQLATSSSGPSQLYKADFVNAQVGWVVGDTGILKTTDGGASWVRQQAGNNLDRFQDVKFPSTSVGWVRGARNLRKTTDGGETWTVVNPDSTGSPYLSAMAVLSTNIVWATGDQGDQWIYKTTDGGAHWNRTKRPDVGRYISMGFADENRGWIVGEDGDMWTTTDGGGTWKAAFNETGEDFYQVRFLNATTGLAVGAGNVILKTTDAGVTWQHMTAERKQQLRAIHFANSTTGWAVGDKGKILKTTDGGKTWKAQAGRLEDEGDGTWDRLSAVKFLNASVGWALGETYSFKTTDGGNHWNRVNLGGSSLDFVDENNGWIAKSDNNGLRTTNGGTTWNVVDGLEAEVLDFVNLSTGWRKSQSDISKTTDGGISWTQQAADSYGFYFLNASTGWVVGAGGTIRKTTDGGATWVPQVSGTSAMLDHIAFADAGNGMAAGSGKLLKTTNGGDTWSMMDSNWVAGAIRFVNAKRAYATSGYSIYKYAVP